MKRNYLNDTKYLGVRLKVSRTKIDTEKVHKKEKIFLSVSSSEYM